MHERLGWRGLAFWTLAFCLHRTAVLCWGFDGAYYWEETYRLLIAEALWERWPWPLLDLQADPYAGGSLVFSLLTVPVVALAGPSLVGLKLVALAWNAVGFVAWTALVDRWWGRLAAHTFAALFILGPPLFVIYNLIAMGSHAEVVTLAGVQLLLAYRVLYRDSHANALDGDAPAASTLVAWGVVAGFGTWFTYASILPFLVCVAVGVLGGALPLRRWPVLAGGFFAGFAPWILTNLVTGGRGLEVVARTFQVGAPGDGRSAGATVEYLGYLLQTGIPLGLQYPAVSAALPGGHPRRLLLPHLYLALYTASFFVILWGWVRHCAQRGFRAGLRTVPELPLLVLFPLLIALLITSDQVFLEHERVPFLSFRLMVPFLPPVMAILAIATARLGPVARLPLLAVLVLIGLAGTVQVLRTGAVERPRQLAEARNVGAHAAGHLLYYKHGADLALLATRIGGMPPELQGAAWEGVGFSLAFHFPADRPAAELVERIHAVPPTVIPDVARGMRAALGSGLAQVKPRAPSTQTEALRTVVDSLDPLKPDQ